jgi:hypothetical protein
MIALAIIHHGPHAATRLSLQEPPTPVPIFFFAGATGSQVRNRTAPTGHPLSIFPGKTRLFVHYQKSTTGIKYNYLE